MIDLGSKRVLVYDSGGLFLSLAFCLSKDFGSVGYYTPNSSPFPLPYLNALGDGFPEIERVHDFWREQSQADLIVFPDTGDASLQLALVEQGRRVWGSRGGDALELRRAWFRRQQGKWGLEVPEHRIVHGVSELRKFLVEHDGWFVKVSRYRGLCETFQYHAGPRGEGQLDQLAAKLGPLQTDFQFLCDAPIDAVVETGSDQYTIDGQWPQFVCQSIETKDKAGISAVTPMSKMPQALRDVNEALTPFLKEQNYRNWFSAEVRITEDKRAFLTDPCSRQASPIGECLLELIGNLGEIIWHGSEGDLVEPEYVAQFAAQAIVDHPDPEEHWRIGDWPVEIRQWFKPQGCVGLEDNRIGFPPFPWSCDAVGSVVGLGASIKEAINKLKEHVAALEHAGYSVHVPALADTISAIDQEEAAGVPFTRQPVPGVAIVLDNA